MSVIWGWRRGRGRLLNVARLAAITVALYLLVACAASPQVAERSSPPAAVDVHAEQGGERVDKVAAAAEAGSVQSVGDSIAERQAEQIKHYRQLIDAWRRQPVAEWLAELEPLQRLASARGLNVERLAIVYQVAYALLASDLPSASSSSLAGEPLDPRVRLTLSYMESLLQPSTTIAMGQFYRSLRLMGLWDRLPARLRAGW